MREKHIYTLPCMMENILKYKHLLLKTCDGNSRPPSLGAYVYNLTYSGLRLGTICEGISHLYIHEWAG